MKTFIGKFTSLLFFRTKDETGFSLLEIVVATALSSVILLMIYSAHRSVMTSVYDLTGIADFYESINLVFEKIERDISYLYYDRGNTKLAFIGENRQGTVSLGKLNFVTASFEPLPLSVNPKTPYPRSDVYEVGYFLVPDSRAVGLYSLMRRADISYDDRPEEGGEIDLLLQNVVDLRFEFWERNHWIEKWDSRETYKIPNAVKTIITVKNYRGNVETFTMLTFTAAETRGRQ